MSHTFVGFVMEAVRSRQLVRAARDRAKPEFEEMYESISRMLTTNAGISRMFAGRDKEQLSVGVSHEGR